MTNYYPVSLFLFMEEVITSLEESNRLRTAESYASTLRSLKRFTGHNDIPLRDVTAAFTTRFESFLKSCGVTRNTSSFYMRILRAVFNRAVNMEIVEPPLKSPFAPVYTGIAKTTKRALSRNVISKIKRLILPRSLSFSRDMFLFSFYARGMSFVDMAYLRKSDFHDGLITYRRRKTGQKITMRVEKELYEIMARYPASPASEYLLPIVTRGGVAGRRQYLCKSHIINRNLKQVGALAGTSMPLTMYMARHSWATIARNLRIPVSVISDALGHDNEATTRIYLATMSSSVIDKANHRVLSSL